MGTRIPPPNPLALTDLDRESSMEWIIQSVSCCKLDLADYALIGHRSLQQVVPLDRMAGVRMTNPSIAGSSLSVTN